jgi:hypothetical protein
MVSVLFPEFKREVLSEDKDDQYESYTGIVIDPVHNEFKVITGNFLDKKDMYTKLTKKGYIVRKSFETRVWKWMEKNAPSNLVAYMMFSTAFSKWKNNNVLGPYYVKLLNDIPQLNREGEKGDPNTTGDKLIKLKKESVLEENYDDIARLKQLTYDNLGVDWNDFFAKSPYQTRILKRLYDNENVEVYDAINHILDQSPEGEYSDRDIDVALKEILDEITEANQSIIMSLPRGHMLPDTEDFRYEMIGVGPNSEELFRNNGIYKAKTDNKEAKGVDYFYDPMLLIDLYNLSKQSDSGEHFSLDPEADSILVNVYGKKDNNKIYAKLLTSNEIKQLVSNKLSRAKSSKYTGYSNNNDYAAVWNQFSNLEPATAVAYKQSRIVGDDIQRDFEDANRLNMCSHVSNVEKFINSWAKFFPVDKGEAGYGLIANITLIKEHLSNFLENNVYKEAFDEGGSLFVLSFLDRLSKLSSNIMSIYNSIPNIKNKMKEMQDVNATRISLLRRIWTDNNESGKEAALDFYKNVYEDAFLINDDFKLDDDKILDEFREVTEALSWTAHKIKKDKQKENIAKNPLLRAIDSIGNVTSNTQKAINNKNPKTQTGSRDEGDTLQMSKDAKKQSYLLKKKVNTSGDNQAKLGLRNMQQLANSDAARTKAADPSPNDMPVVDKELINSINVDDLKSLLNIDDIKTEAYVNDGATALLNSDRMASERMYNTPSTILPMRGTIINEDSTHDELNQSLFDGTVLREDVRNALLKISDKFLEYIDIPFKPVDTFFTGSCANYNYNDNSDIDLHLVFDYEKVGINEEILDKYLKSAKNNFNKKYSISVKGIPVELGCENVNEPLVSTGVYSLVTNKWISKPSFKSVEFNGMPDDAYLDVKEKLETIISSKDIITIENAVKSLGKLRKVSLKNDGEFGIGNLLFKRLRADGVIEDLKNAYYDSESKELSLESMEDL